LIGYRPVNLGEEHDPATFQVAASAYSLAQEAFVAHSKESLVWYDYEKLKKCQPDDNAVKVLHGRMLKG